VTLVDFTLGQFLLFALVLFRTTGMLLTAPVIGSRNLPTQLKLGLAMMVALLILPLLGPAAAALPKTPGALFLAALGETLVGMIIGFAASLLFAAVQLAGMLMDQELGLSLANVIDPLSNEQVSVIGQLKLLLATGIFLGLEGHHMLLGAVADSFAVVPVTGFHWSPALALRLGDELVGQTFDIAVRLAAPVVVTMLLTTIALGFLARAVPEMNIFIVGFSVRIVVGLVVILLAVGGFAAVFSGLAIETGAQMPQLVEAMK